MVHLFSFVKLIYYDIMKYSIEEKVFFESPVGKIIQ
ncbi:hypothetical protein GB978_03150 [Streptococcus mutans]|nr:hypothetical protein [Streptococcus mutans]